jgi:glycosyltransferase involved in cell wall biosynthesis
MSQTTILIPTYNCGKYIKQAITSILNQEYEDYELLIIDDGSDDDTEKIVSTFKDDRIVYLKNRRNLGIVKTLNKGINLAKGIYIARKDADDIMLGNRLKDQIGFLECQLEHGMVGGWYKIINVQGKLVDSIKTLQNHEDIKLGLLFKNQFAHPAVTIRTHLLKKLKYREGYLYTEDYDLWCRVAEITKVANLSDFYLSYRWYANNTCNKNQKELKAAVIKLLSRQLNKYEIDHTVGELAMHAAICFGYKIFFNNTEKIQRLNEWLDKVFAAPKVQKISSPFFLRCLTAL